MSQQTKRRKIRLGFCDEPADEGQHICLLYNDDEERLKLIASYLVAGKEQGEKLLYLVDCLTPKQMLKLLTDLGVDIDSRPENLLVADAASGYCPGGVFNADQMLEKVKSFYLQALEEGYAGARGTGEMTWCLVEGRADRIKLMDYEARLNELLAEYPYTACCQYDLSRFSGDLIMDVLATHPLLIVRGQLVRNPFYIEPRVFLGQYLKKRSGWRS